jgi:polyhydroxybutyrate depolymerase
MDIRRGWALLAIVVLALAGCSGPSDQPTPTPTPSDSTVDGSIQLTVGSRPVALRVPPGYNPATAAPLLILLHGYSSNGSAQEGYLKFGGEADKRGVLYAIPDGTPDSRNNRFWNATDACCNLYGSTVDDVAFLVDVVKAVAAKYTVDTRRVYLFGHSNGAFMSFRMACDQAGVFTAIAALNGAMENNVSDCRPSRPVSVLNIRATNDNTIVNSGGQINGNTYPSTAQTVADWVQLDACQATPQTRPEPLDLESAVSGPETTVASYPGCAGGSRVELWTIQGSGHVPAFTAAFAPAVFDFLLASSAA